ncbi:hypothetical protein QTO34_001780 [Cnephaeus nilssonii]|uniref:Uncharacterized protein n=1 Tax=Cnephaeus nilssonii TaxID=3371016 RepID=A0AA40HTH7_CNENI|nr:hypothetical protein QTO34_001780 [Eptesicus nilssonii]
MQTGAATVENSMEFPQKIKNGPAVGSRRSQTQSEAVVAVCTMDSAPEGYELNGDLRLDSPNAPDTPPTRWGRNRPINVNHYTNKKSTTESMLDITLLRANTSQPKAVIGQGPGFGFFVLLVVQPQQPSQACQVDFNNLATGLFFIIVVVNIFIATFSVRKPVVDLAPWQ